MWDAEWNAGIGQHSASMTYWPDLVNGILLRKYGSPTIGSNYVQTSSQYTYFRNASFPSLGTDVTFEFCCSDTTSYSAGSRTYIELIKTGDVYNGYRLQSEGRYFTVQADDNWSGRNQSTTVTPSGGTFAMTASITDDAKAGYIDGVQIVSGTVSLSAETNPDIFSLCFTKNGASNEFVATKIHCVRVYTRVLSSSELAANYAADQRRFTS